MDCPGGPVGALDDLMPVLLELTPQVLPYRGLKLTMIVIAKQVGGRGSILVRQGQEVTIGRTAWADHSFPQDPNLEPIHFCIQCRPAGAVIQTVAGASLKLDGEETTRAFLKSGQLIEAGNTSFQVVIEGAAEMDPAVDAMLPANDDSEVAEKENESSSGWVSAAATLEDLSLEPIGDLCTEPPSNAIDLAKLLGQHGRHGDAIQVLAWSVPRQLAVVWAADCVEQAVGGTLTQEELAAVEAARAWAADPTESKSMAARDAAEAAGLDVPAGWVAQAAFWSGNNLSPADLPAVKPPPALASAAVKGAIIALAFAQRPDAPDVTMNEALSKGYGLAAL